MILVRLTGGLGNQMFQYALGLALSKEHGQGLFYDTSLLGKHDLNKKKAVIRNFDLDIFPISAQKPTIREVWKFNGKPQPNIFARLIYKYRQSAGKYLLIVQNKHQKIEFEKKAVKNNLCIVGRWQSEDYFKKHKDFILKEFAWSKFTPNNYSQNLINQFRNNTLISIQVRRGDYINHPEYSVSIGGLTSNYYIEAMTKMKSFFDETVKLKFLVISDDIEWCELNFAISDDIIFVKQEKSKVGYVSDLWLLTQCQHSIISNSTFAWWGAWLAEKKHSRVIAPLQWTRDRKNQPPNIIPQRWIQINNEFEPLQKQFDKRD